MTTNKNIFDLAGFSRFYGLRYGRGNDVNLLKKKVENIYYKVNISIVE